MAALWLHSRVTDRHELSRVARVLTRWPLLPDQAKRSLEEQLNGLEDAQRPDIAGGC